jgi:hypothetical protein
MLNGYYTIKTYPETVMSSIGDVAGNTTDATI